MRQLPFFGLSLLALPAAAQPNIIFLFSDDHAERAISAYSGGELNETPNIDRLADEGALFLNNTVANSICAPSRASILTGTHSHINGQLANWNTFNADQTTFPQVLQLAGYDTALIGKWHLRSKPRGFDYTDIMDGQGEYYNPRYQRNSGSWRTESGYNTIVTTDLGLEWLESRQESGTGEPFFLALQYKAPHRNWMPAIDQLDAYDDVVFPEPSTLFDDYNNRASGIHQQRMEIGRDMQMGHDLKTELSGLTRTEYNRMNAEQKAAWDTFLAKRRQEYLDAGGSSMGREALTRWKYQAYLRDYLACINTVDEQVGRVLDYLSAHGLAENTLVIYSSDQGFFLGEHGWFDKRWMYHESFAMPLLARWPGVIEPGTRIEALTQNIDFAPTFLDVADFTIPSRMQGQSLLPLMQGEVPSDWREAVYYQFYAENESHNVPVHEGVSTNRYKLIHYHDLDEWELFDRETDPHEINNVYRDPAYSEIRRGHYRQLMRLRKQYAVTSPRPPPGPELENCLLSGGQNPHLELNWTGSHPGMLYTLWSTTDFETWLPDRTLESDETSLEIPVSTSTSAWRVSLP
jgi:arylsulfatase A-like enzyme